MLAAFTVYSAERQLHTDDSHCTYNREFEFWRLSLKIVHQTAAAPLVTYRHTQTDRYIYTHTDTCKYTHRQIHTHAQ